MNSVDASPFTFVHSRATSPVPFGQFSDIDTAFWCLNHTRSLSDTSAEAVKTSARLRTVCQTRNFLQSEIALFCYVQVIGRRLRVKRGPVWAGPCSAPASIAAFLCESRTRTDA
jgi:hypothetical protein